jgi:hypothetical protein
MEYDTAISVPYRSSDPIKNLKIKVVLQKKLLHSDLKTTSDKPKLIPLPDTENFEHSEEIWRITVQQLLSLLLTHRNPPPM